MKTWETTLARVRSEFTENARARGGAWLILGLMLIYGLLVQSDRLQDAYAAYAEEARRLARSETLRGGDWTRLLAAEREANRALTGAFWRAETEGEAQARLQAVLTAMTKGLDLRRLRIRSGVNQEVPELPGVWQVQSSLDCHYRPGAELQIVHRLATHPKKLVVERLDVDRRALRMTLIVSASFMGIASTRGEPERPVRP